MSERLEALRREMDLRRDDRIITAALYRARGYRAHADQENVLARAYGVASLLTDSPKRVYEHDLIAGSLTGLMIRPDAVDKEALDRASALCDNYGERSFITNNDHFAPDYGTLLDVGVGGLIRRVEASRAAHAGDGDRVRFLDACEICLRAFSEYIAGYAGAASALAERTPTRADELRRVADACRAVACDPPRTFRQALQLTMLTHMAFCCEGRRAMALGRLDQYLWPFYDRDIRAGRLTETEAEDLTACALIKLGEMRLTGGDDVVNIAVGGVTRAGADATNALSALIVRAVGACNLPGPNLSARIHPGTPDQFLDECLKVIGTGLGYPALMNDQVNMAALRRYGYDEADVRDYCMVGCIENFMPGRQPPWSDGRFNTPLYVLLALNRGVDLLTGEREGPDTGDPAAFDTMDGFLTALKAQLRYGAARYMAAFRNQNERLDQARYMSPLLSCFCRDCISRGRDINDGGAVYPSAHGVACMGIGTVADSLCAIEQLVYVSRSMTLGRMTECLRDDFIGHETERRMMLAAPKYGNDDDRADKWAVWFVSVIDELFTGYRTWDGGPVYTAIAANVQSISAGREVGATPDGRSAREPLSDAASPTYGRDKKGPTAALLSVSKPDYTRVACGTVLNQKYTPDMFRTQEMRDRLRAMIRVYFDRGGQEIQINAVSRDTLIDAMARPAEYDSLVVRVSGFSAYFTMLDRAVQMDILARTEHS